MHVDIKKLGNIPDDLLKQPTRALHANGTIDVDLGVKIRVARIQPVTLPAATAHSLSRGPDRTCPGDGLRGHLPERISCDSTGIPSANTEVQAVRTRRPRRLLYFGGEIW
ncbi:hypothetical protein [Streptomyces sp. TSRI0281]|uniref:hypothetical protein n=1 Tax=Streptomyces sp. TSRI0281 TaxID=1718998 RepID=UPI000A5175C5